MNLTVANQASRDYSSFSLLPQRASRVKSAPSKTNLELAGRQIHRANGLLNNSFDCSDLRASQFFAATSEPRQLYCCEVMWNGFTTPPDYRRHT